MKYQVHKIIGTPNTYRVMGAENDVLSAGCDCIGAHSTHRAAMLCERWLGRGTRLADGCIITLADVISSAEPEAAPQPLPEAEVVEHVLDLPTAVPVEDPAVETERTDVGELRNIDEE